MGLELQHRVAGTGHLGRTQERRQASDRGDVFASPELQVRGLDVGPATGSRMQSTGVGLRGAIAMRAAVMAPP